MECHFVPLAQHRVHAVVRGHGEVLVHRSGERPDGRDHIVQRVGPCGEDADQPVVQREARVADGGGLQTEQCHQLTERSRMTLLVGGPRGEEIVDARITPRHQRLDPRGDDHRLDTLGVLEGCGQIAHQTWRVSNGEVDVVEDQRGFGLHMAEGGVDRRHRSMFAYLPGRLPPVRDTSQGCHRGKMAR